MSITKILYRTVILFICSIIQIIGVLIEGAHNLLGKLVEYLKNIHDKLLKRTETKTEEEEKH